MEKAEKEKEKVEREKELVKQVFVYLTEGCYNEELTGNQKRVIRKKAKKFEVKNGVLYYLNVKRGCGSSKTSTLVKYILEESEKNRILNACHMDPTSGHMGIKRTLSRITERFYWPGVSADVNELVTTCDVCQKGNRKISAITPELHPIPVKSPWYHIGIDYIGPLSPTSASGNRYILTISDYFTKWVEAVPLPSKHASVTANALFKIFMRMGIPRVITTDQGSEFRNNLNTAIASLLNIKHQLTTAYHPQANGLDERFNQTIQGMVAKFVKNKEDWDEYLDTCVFAYNTSRHESTAYTPFELQFGRKAYLPVDVISSPEEHLKEWLSSACDVQTLTEKRQQLFYTAKSKIKAAQKKQKFYYDLKHAKPCLFAVGTKVLLKNFTRKKRKGGKLEKKWTGPYKIMKHLGKGVYCLSSLTNPGVKVKKVIGSHLKEYKTPKVKNIYSSKPSTHVSDLPRLDLSSSDRSTTAQVFRADDLSVLPTFCDIADQSSSHSYLQLSLVEKTSKTEIHIDELEEYCVKGFCTSSPTKESGFFHDFPGEIDLSPIPQKEKPVLRDLKAKPVKVKSLETEDLKLKPEYLKPVKNKNFKPIKDKKLKPVEVKNLKPEKSNHKNLPVEVNNFKPIKDKKLKPVEVKNLKPKKSNHKNLPVEEKPVEVKNLKPEKSNHKNLPVEEKPVEVKNLKPEKSNHKNLPVEVKNLKPIKDKKLKPVEVKNLKPEELKHKVEVNKLKPENLDLKPVEDIKLKAVEVKNLKTEDLNPVEMSSRKRTAKQPLLHNDLQKKQRTIECPFSSINHCMESFNLTIKDKQAIQDGGWLTDTHINIFNALMLHQFPSQNGLQCPLILAEFLKYASGKENFIQIINLSRKHWICISNVFSSPGVVEVYDSLPSCSLKSFSLKLQVAAILHTSDELFILRHIQVQRQEGGNDCALFAMAFAVSICLRQDPYSVTYCQAEMRQHFLDCITNKCLLPFPILKEGRRLPRTRKLQDQQVIVFCECRLPWDRNFSQRGSLVQCSVCKTWYHETCKGIDKDIIEQPHMKYICNICLQL